MKYLKMLVVMGLTAVSAVILLTLNASAAAAEYIWDGSNFNGGSMIRGEATVKITAGAGGMLRLDEGSTVTLVTDSTVDIVNLLSFYMAPSSVLNWDADIDVGDRQSGVRFIGRSSVGGTVNMVGGSYTTTADNAFYFGTDRFNINIRGGTVTAGRYAAVILGGGTVNISGGTITTTRANGSSGGIIAIGGETENTPALTVNMSGGTINSTAGTAFCLYDSDTLRMTGGTINTVSAVEVYEGAYAELRSGRINTSGTALKVFDGELATATNSLIINAQGNAVENDGGTVELRNGSITAQGSRVISNIGGGDVTIYNEFIKGTGTGADVIYLAGNSTLSISNSIIAHTGSNGRTINDSNVTTTHITISDSAIVGKGTNVENNVVYLVSPARINSSSILILYSDTNTAAVGGTGGLTAYISKNNAYEAVTGRAFWNNKNASGGISIVRNAGEAWDASGNRFADLGFEFVAETPVINVHPVSATYGKGQTARALGVSNSATISYGDPRDLNFAWQTSTDGVNWITMASANRETYSPSTVDTGTFYYRLAVTNPNGVPTTTVYSDPATIEVVALWGSSGYHATASDGGNNIVVDNNSGGVLTVDDGVTVNVVVSRDGSAAPSTALTVSLGTGSTVNWKAYLVKYGSTLTGGDTLLTVTGAGYFNMVGLGGIHTTVTGVNALKTTGGATVTVNIDDSDINDSRHIVAWSGYSLVNDGATVTLTNGYIGTSASKTVINNIAGTLNLNGGFVNVTNNTTVYRIINSGTLNIDGTDMSAGSAGIHNRTGGALNFESGLLTANTAYGIYNEGTFSMSDGTLTVKSGATGILYNASTGNAAVSGGLLESYVTSNSSKAITNDASSGSVVLSGDATIVAAQGWYAGNKPTISEGDVAVVHCRVGMAHLGTSDGITLTTGEADSDTHSIVWEIRDDRGGLTYGGKYYDFGVVIHAETPVITLQPVAAAYVFNQAMTALTVECEVRDGGDLSYQWYSSATQTATNSALIPGATNASYTPPANIGYDIYYLCRITNVNEDVNGMQSSIIRSDVVKVTSQILWDDDGLTLSTNATTTVVVDEDTAGTLQVLGGSSRVTIISSGIVTSENTLRIENPTGAVVDWQAKFISGGAAAEAGVLTLNGGGTYAINGIVGSTSRGGYALNLPGTIDVNLGSTGVLFANRSSMTFTGYFKDPAGGAEGSLMFTYSPSSIAYDVGTDIATFTGISTTSGSTVRWAGTYAQPAISYSCGANTGSVPIPDVAYVEAISLGNDITVYLSDGSSNVFDLTPVFTPASPTNQSVTWASGDTSIATVATNGRITPQDGAAGKTVTITVTTKDGSITDSCDITFVDPDAPLTDATVSTDSSTYDKKDGGSYDITLTPGDYTLLSITDSADYTLLASDYAVANNVYSIAEAYLKRQANGALTLTFDMNGGADPTVTLTLSDSTVAVTSVEITGSDGVLIGSSITLTADVEPDNATNDSVVWSSADASIARVDSDGAVTGIGAGTVLITATAADGSGVSDTHSVTVTAPLPTVVSVTVYPAAPTLERGATQVFTATVNGTNNPDQSVTWSVDGNSSDGTAFDGSTLTIGTGETAASFTVTATSVYNSAVSGTATVTVRNPLAVVSTVTITGSDAAMPKGTSRAFTATVTGVNSPSQAVVWSVSGGSSAETRFEGSTLYVSADETATSLTVRAESSVDSTKFDTLTVALSNPPATVTGVTVTPNPVSVVKGNTQAFSAEVTGTNDPAQTVTWTVSGATSDGTVFDGNILTVGRGETANVLTVRATSTADTSKYGTAAVSVADLVYNIVMSDGTATVNDVVTDTAPPGAIVTITYNERFGWTFDEWTTESPGVEFDNPNSFTMPENDVAITATYERIPPITNPYDNLSVVSPMEPDVGDTVTARVTSDGMAEIEAMGFVFHRWFMHNVTELGDFEAETDGSPYQPTVTFSMPSGYVITYLLYGYPLEVEDGTATIGGTPVTTYSFASELEIMDETIIITADDKPGYEFVNWTFTSDGSVGDDPDSGVTLVNSDAAETVLLTEYGCAPVNIKANYRAVVDAQTPTIGSQSSNQTASVGDDITLAVSASVSDGGILSYQWYSSDGTVAANGIISTATGNTTSDGFKPSTAAVGTYYYYCLVTNTSDGATGEDTASAATSVITVTVSALVDAQTPTIGSQSSNQTASIGDDITLAVSASVSDGGVLSYQWYTSDGTVAANGTISTATGNTTSDGFKPSTAAVGTYYYYCLVTNYSDGATGDTTASAATTVITVTVSAAEVAFVPVTGIINLPAAATAGTDLILTGTVTPDDATNKSIIWSVSDGGTTGAAIVGSTLSTAAAGRVIVLATIQNGVSDGTDYTQSFEITVSEPGAAYVPVTGVTLYGASRMTVGSSMIMGAHVMPANADNKRVGWYSTDPAVADVTGGIVTARRAGRATITVVTEDGGYSGSITVTVYEPYIPPAPPVILPESEQSEQSEQPKKPEKPECECGCDCESECECPPNLYVTDGMTVSDGCMAFTTKNGIEARIIVTSDDSVYVIAGANKTGSLNSPSTAAAVAKAAWMALQREQKTLPILALNITGVSSSAAEKLVKAGEGVDLILKIEATNDDDAAILRMSIPLGDSSGQILPGMKFNTESINDFAALTAERFSAANIVGGFETEQDGGWGAAAQITLNLDELGITARDGKRFYLLHYDSKADKWFQITATAEDGFLVFKTKLTGVFAVSTTKI
jgi:uncharacterized protein YjdB